MTYKGTFTVYHVGDTVQPKDTFIKRELIATVYDLNTKYPQTVTMQAVQGETKLLDGLGVGDVIDCEFELTGKLYTNKLGKEQAFTNLTIKTLTVTAKQKPADSADKFDDVPF